MGQTQSVATEIEIQAPPEKVRSVFMDFPRYKEWSKWAIEPIDSEKTPSDLKTDDVLKVTMGMSFRPTIIENTPEHFVWEGNLYGLFVGRHYFVWSPSKKTPGATTMIQKEDFSGPLSFFLGQGWSARQQTIDNWDTFFVDLKKEVEKSSP